jgi:hypothetical protein
MKRKLGRLESMGIIVGTANLLDSVGLLSIGLEHLITHLLTEDYEASINFYK